MSKCAGREAGKEERGRVNKEERRKKRRTIIENQDIRRGAAVMLDVSEVTVERRIHQASCLCRL